MLFRSHYDSDLEDIAMLDNGDLGTGHLIIYDYDERKWVSLGGDTLRNTLGLGTMSTQDSNSVVITGGTINGIDPITVESGGTGASSSEEAWTNLDAQQHSDRLDRIASLDHNNIDNQIIMSLGGGIDQWNIITAETARVELGLKIGTSADSGDVQAYSDALQSYSDGNPIPADRVEYGQYFIDTTGVGGQFWSADEIGRAAWREGV